MSFKNATLILSMQNYSLFKIRHNPHNLRTQPQNTTLIHMQPTLQSSVSFLYLCCHLISKILVKIKNNKNNLKPVKCLTSCQYK